MYLCSHGSERAEELKGLIHASRAAVLSPLFTHCKCISFTLMQCGGKGMQIVWLLLHSSAEAEKCNQRIQELL